MNPPRKTHYAPTEENSTAEPELTSEETAQQAPSGGEGAGQGVQDWREQSEPHPITYPDRMPETKQGDEPPKTKAPAEPAQQAALPGAPYVAGTAITITPYTAAGHPTIYVMGNEQLGSEFALQMSIRNQVHLPALKV